MYNFEEQNGSLLFRENGETVMITPWEPDSLRVRASMSGQIYDESDALLEPEINAEASKSKSSLALEEFVSQPNPIVNLCKSTDTRCPFFKLIISLYFLIHIFVYEEL